MSATSGYWCYMHGVVYRDAVDLVWLDRQKCEEQANSARRAEYEFRKLKEYYRCL